MAAGGHVAILDILPTAPPECQKLIDGSGRCHYFTYVGAASYRGMLTPVYDMLTADSIQM